MRAKPSSPANDLDNNECSNLQVVDLFSGVGGLSLGAARAGFSICGAVEIDPHAVETHKRNFPNSIHIFESVTALTGRKLRMRLNLHNGDLTGIVGGPPCQGFSDIGKRDLNDPRNALFPEFFRIVSEAKPKFFLAENVPRIRHDKNAKFIEKALSYVEDDYEVVTDLTINASKYGAPTTRTRSFFFGTLKGAIETLTEKDFAPHGNIKKIFVKDALRGLPEDIDPNWQTEEQSWQPVEEYDSNVFEKRLAEHIPKGVGDPIALERLKKGRIVSGFLGTIHTKKVIERFADTKPGRRENVSRTIRLNPNGFCPTLRAGTGVDHGSHQALRPIHPTQDRMITPREAARLQGFPDWFQFHPTKWHSFRQIGNSVSPIVAERILTVIKKSLS